MKNYISFNDGWLNLVHLTPKQYKICNLRSRIGFTRIDLIEFEFFTTKTLRVDSFKPLNLAILSKEILRHLQKRSIVYVLVF